MCRLRSPPPPLNRSMGASCCRQPMSPFGKPQGLPGTRVHLESTAERGRLNPVEGEPNKGDQDGSLPRAGARFGLGRGRGAQGDGVPGAAQQRGSHCRSGVGASFGSMNRSKQQGRPEAILLYRPGEVGEAVCLLALGLDLKVASGQDLNCLGSGSRYRLLRGGPAYRRRTSCHPRRTETPGVTTARRRQNPMRYRPDTGMSA